MFSLQLCAPYILTKKIKEVTVTEHFEIRDDIFVFLTVMLLQKKTEFE